MMQEVAVNLTDYFKLPNPGLKAMFGRILKGSDIEYRTPLFDGRSLDDILSSWLNELESIKSEWPGLFEFEIDLASKVGPMSIMKPLDQRLPDIRSYWDHISQDSEPIDTRALDQLVSDWGKLRGLTLKDQWNTILDMKKSTNSGSPFYTKKRDVVKDTYPTSIFTDELKSEVTQYLGNNSEEFKACAVLGWRGQEGGRDYDDVKQRTVWMMPFSLNIRELQVYQPMINTCQKFNYVPAWVSQLNVDKHVTKLFDTKRSNDLIICTDFTKFDQHFGPACQDAARYLFNQWLSKNEQSQLWLEEVFPAKYYIPLVLDGNIMYTGRHAMGSGSGGTLGDETPVHKALQIESAMRCNTKLNPYSMCLGDDGILSYPHIDVDKVVEHYSSHGLDMNPDKQSVSTDECVYLRRWYHVNYRRDGICRGVYSTCRALGKLCEQERFIGKALLDNGQELEYSKLITLRSLSILENISTHPLRERFVDYVLKGDKYRLGLAIPGFLDKRNLDKLWKETHSIRTHLFNYNTLQQSETNKGGMNEWWIVNYLRSKQ